MYETDILSIPKYAENIFRFFLSLYPHAYKRQFSTEMVLLFQDMYQEEVDAHGFAGITFWMTQLGDLTKSIMVEHLHEMQKKGMKNYLQETLHINTYNIISILFLLPVVSMTGIEIVSRIVQRDVTHYNRPVYAYFSHTFLYWTPVLFTWVILFPLIAAAISFIPLVKALIAKKNRVFDWKFVVRNSMSILILLFGVGFIILIRLHDFLPCVLYGLTHFGFGQVPHILSVCKNA